MTSLITLPNDHLAVTVPEGAYSIAIKGNVIGYASKKFYGPEFIELPEGSYTIVALGSEISEEQAGEIVEKYIYSGRISYYAYKDYSGKTPESEDDIITDPVVAFDTLLASLSLEASTTLILKQNK